MVQWLGFEREKLKEKILDIAEKDFNSEPLKDNEKNLIQGFKELNEKISARFSIERFFELLEDVVSFDNKRGEYAEDFYD